MLKCAVVQQRRGTTARKLTSEFDKSKGQDKNKKLVNNTKCVKYNANQILLKGTTVSYKRFANTSYITSLQMEVFLYNVSPCMTGTVKEIPK